MTRRPSLSSGMTLVELMVGLALGMFLVTVMGTIYLGNRATFAAQESGSRTQENGRFVMDTIANDVRMSGFRGCLGINPVDNTLNTPAALLYDFATPIWGSRNGGAWSPALTAPASGLGALAAGDVLVIRRPTGPGWSLINEMSSVTAALSITPTGNFAQGDLLMVADCAGASVLQATNANPGTSGSIAHAVGAGTPGVARNAFTRVFSNDAVVWRMQTLIYYLANSVRRPGQTALWVYANPAYDGREQVSELVAGVERLAFTFGVDTDSDFAADRFRSADQVANWAQVVSVRVELLMAGSTESATTVAQPYVFDGQSVTPGDRRQRTVMSMLVSLRNSVR